MKRRMLCMALALLLAGTLTACAGRTEPQTGTVGDWNLTTGQKTVLPEEVQTGFDKAVGDKKLVPLALVAQQVVAGTNDMILCEDGGEYVMIVVYRDLQGNAELTKQTPFLLPDYTQGEEVSPKQLAGGWNVPETLTSVPLPEDAKTAFDKALNGFVGSNVEPMVLLGTQLVSGTNYAVLCRVTPVVQDPVSTVEVVRVYADLSGNAKFETFTPVRPEDFNG